MPLKRNVESLNLKDIKSKLDVFSKEREWAKYHTPKNISMALSVEAAELLEIFQWMTEEESFQVKTSSMEKMGQIQGQIQGQVQGQIQDELADILLYAIRLSDILEIDLPKAIEKKMEKNATKYPVSKARGNAKKYTEFTSDFG